MRLVLIAIEAVRVANLSGLGVLNGEAVPPFTIFARHSRTAPDLHRSTVGEVLRTEQRISLESSCRFPAKPSETGSISACVVGYFSADFHNHATMYLIAQIFALHDKSRFEIFAYSYGPDKQDEMRKKLVSAVDVFHDVREMNDMQLLSSLERKS